MLSEINLLKETGLPSQSDGGGRPYISRWLDRGDRPVEQQLVEASIYEQGGVPGLAADPGAGGDTSHRATLMHHQTLGFGQLPCNHGGERTQK